MSQDLSVTAKSLAADEAAYAASQGRTTDYSQIIDDVGGNRTEDRAQLVRDTGIKDAEHIRDQEPTRWPG